MDKQRAHDFVNKHGKEVAKNPGGNEKMGFYPVGPKEDTTAAKAQSHVGNVKSGSTFAEIQAGAMKGKK